MTLWYRVARLRTGRFSSTPGSQGAQNHFVWESFDHELSLAEKFGEDFRVVEGPFNEDERERRKRSRSDVAGGPP